MHSVNFIFFNIYIYIFPWELGILLSYKASFICREGGMEKKTFPFELTDLQ